MISYLLKSTNRLTSKFLGSSVRLVHKGPEGAPPMRYISPVGHVTRYLILVFTILSYPTYVLYSMDNLRPRPPNELSEEMQEIMNQRKALRKEGAQPILQDWPAIHEKKN